MILSSRDVNWRLARSMKKGALRHLTQIEIEDTHRRLQRRAQRRLGIKHRPITLDEMRSKAPDLLRAITALNDAWKHREEVGHA